MAAAPTATSGSAHRPGTGIPGGGTVLRLLNLLFTLHVSPVPLTTEQIVGDADMGYGSGNPESNRRKFLRDRERLKSCGVVIREVSSEGASEREESRWVIDRQLTHAQAGVIEREDAEAVLAALDEHISLNGNDPARWPLQRARAKLAELADFPVDAPQAFAHTQENTALRHIWSAFDRRRAARFTYRDARGDERGREVEIYAFFTQGCHTYLVGRCRDTDRVLTFRTDRIVSTRKSPDSGAPYAIPEDFSVQRYRFLPFDFSEHEPVEAVFSFPGSLGGHELELLTHGRGGLERGAGDGADARWLWRVDVRDLGAAASFALEHGSRGMRAEEPAELVRGVEELVQRVVKIHGAR